MDIGRDYAHVGQIFPFKDRPDVGVKVLFYPVPLSGDAVPYPNPFVLRNWDIRENLPQTPLGTDQNFKILFFGKKPVGPPGAVCGNGDLWTNGVSYADWQAGRYGMGCDPCTCGVWSELCQTILPKVLNVSGDFGFAGQPFTTTATWSNASGLNVWICPPVPFVCNGVTFHFTFSLIEDTGQPAWAMGSDGGDVFCDPVVCTYPQSWRGDSPQLQICGPPDNFGPVFATVFFTAP